MIIVLPELLEDAWARALPPFSRARFRANRTLNRHRFFHRPMEARR